MTNIQSLYELGLLGRSLKFWLGRYLRSMLAGYGMFRFDNSTATLSWVVYHQIGSTASISGQQVLIA